MTEQGKYPPHPAADCFPMMVEDAFDGLVADIKAHGLRHPIVLTQYDNQWTILDGRNRDRACDAAGVKKRYDYYDGDDPIGYAASVNLARRHMNQGQRALIADALHELDKQLNPTANFSKSREKAARAMNVGESTVRAAGDLKREAEPEVVKAVQEGAIKLGRATEISKIDDRKEQLDALEEAKQSAGTREPRESRGMMTVERLLKESEVAQLRALVMVGADSDDPRAHQGIRVLVSIAPMVHP